MRKAIVALVVLTAVLAAGCGRLRTPEPEGPAPAGTGTQAPGQGITFDDPQPAPDFTLTDQHGNTFRLADQKGRAVALFFGYTHCPDVCPTTLAWFRQAHRDLGPLAERVRFVFITVDPERDTPERLRQYLAAYGEDMPVVALTGTREQLAPVWQSYNVYVEKAEGSDPDRYQVNHTALTYLIDPGGWLRKAYPFGTEGPALVADVQQIFDGVIATDVWARPARKLEGTGATAVYMVLENTGKVDDSLVAAATDVAERTELHVSNMEGNVMKMQRVDYVPVPRGQKVALRPGGLHIMLLDLKQDLQPGDTFPLRLTFAHAGEVRVMVTVRDPAGSPEEPHAEQHGSPAAGGGGH